MKGREMWRSECWWPGCTGEGGCPGCSVSFAFNLWRQFCACGAPATGYRSMGADIDVEFFCDEHFQDVPQSVRSHEQEQR